jgi:hypothetical protein
MAGKYLVPCDCGQQLPASVHQAGATLQCTCGAQVDVPPLRKLREFPPAHQQPPDTVRTWSPRHSLAVGGTSLVAGLLLWAGYLWSTEPPPPAFPQQQYAANIEGVLENWTPLQFWRQFMQSHHELAEQGFEEITSPRTEAIEAYIAQRQFFRNILLAAAVVVALVTIAAWLAWPSPRQP